MNLSDEPNNTFEPSLTESKPVLTDEQYAKMAALHNRIKELKQGGFDLLEILDALKKDVNRVESELADTRTELVEKNQEIQTCYEEFIFKPYQITGQIAISDTSPHYINVLDQSN